MVRVCMLLNNFEPPFGGPELQAQNIAIRLLKLGHKVFFIAKGSGSKPEFEMVEGIPLYRLNIKKMASIEALYRLWLLRDEFDIIHVHGVGRLSSVAIYFALFFNKKVYIEVTTTGSIYKESSSHLKNLLTTLMPFKKRKIEILKKAHGMIALNKEIITELKQNNFSQNKILYIPVGVDTNKFRPVSKIDKSVFRTKLNLPIDKNIFIYTGKIRKLKGIDTLLMAWDKAHSVRNNSLLVLVGSGDRVKDSLEEWVSQFIGERGLTSSILYTGPVGNVNEYLAAADFFVFPSRSEGLPNSLLEAMATGLICLVSDIPGNIDVVESGKTGYLIPPENIDAWAKALEFVSNFRDQVIGFNAASYIRERFDINSRVKALLNLYTCI